MTEYRLRIGPLVIELALFGTEVDIIGNYGQAEPDVAADARIEAHLSAEFLEGRTKSAKYPAFESNSPNEDTLELERFDARGSINLANADFIVGHFEGHANPNSVEAMIRIVASIALPKKSTLIVHSSAIESDGVAHLFAGISGAGKSTIAALLGANYKVRVLSDELLLLSKRGGKWWLDVAPFSGKIDLPHGRSAPLASVNFLEQADHNERTRVGLHHSMGELPHHIVTYANHPATLRVVLNLIGDIIESTPCYKLEFSNDPRVGLVLELPCL